MPETSNRPLRVFLCHSSNDKPLARELYQKLCAEEWLKLWLDEEELYPGQDWNLEIEKAAEAADAILVCLSNNSVTKEGYVQREPRIVLDHAGYKPEGTLYIIPVRLEECEPPRKLRAWQYADYFPEERREQSLRRLLISLRKRANSLGLTRNYKITLNNGMELMLVQAGVFWMGRYRIPGDEYEQHRVDIPCDYWISLLPVTDKLYNAYLNAHATKRHLESWKRLREYPVDSVSWGDAMAYCQWLNGSFKRGKLHSGLILRLPTEAEWEKASTGEHSPSGIVHEAHDKISSWFTHKFSHFDDNEFNPWEWTHSLYKPYPYKADDGREDEWSSGARVLRGGDFDEEERWARSWPRIGRDPHDDSYRRSFRVVLAPAISEVIKMV